MAKTLVRAVPRRSSASRSLWIGAILILAIFGSLVVIMNVQTKPVTYTKEQARKNVGLVATKYLDGNKNPDKWWMEKVEIERIGESLGSFENKRRQLLGLLEKHRAASPLATKISDRFKEIYVSVEYQGHSLTVSTSSTATPVGTEICFVPKVTTAQHPSSLYWDKQWGALKILALEWPEKFLAGIIFHELGHGLCFFEKRRSAVAAPSSMLYIAEEIDMHELELDVIDHACGGEYRKTIRDIIKTHNVRDWPSLMATITVEDLHALDRVIGAESYGPRTGQVISAQHLLALCLSVMEPDQATPERKIELYRWLAQVFS